MGLRNQRKEINTLFLDLGYTPRTTFNAMNGHTRLIFNDIANERRVDIFLNEFEMCHKFDFTNRLKMHSLTLPLADLLLTKLQVYEITEREYKDVIALLKDFKLSDGDADPDTINAKYIAKLCSKDWGLWKTLSLNLERIEESLPTYVPGETERAAVKREYRTAKEENGSGAKNARLEDEGKGWRESQVVSAPRGRQGSCRLPSRS